MNVILFGASGMVGSAVLLECLEDARITSVLVIGRTSSGIHHPKVEEILHNDFFNYSAIQDHFLNKDACLFCLGVSSVGMDKEKYEHLTYDLTFATAQAILAVNPNLTFCYLSAQGTDGTEKSRTHWARVRGKLENTLMRMPFKASYVFRPGLIQPLKGVKSKTPVYQRTYDIIGPVMPLILRLFGGHATTSVRLARAMLRAADSGYEKRVLENEDINKLGA